MNIEDLIEDIENYTDSIDDDINTIQNYDMTCCDERELEALQNVFRVLDRILKKAKKDNK